MLLYIFLPAISLNKCMYDIRETVSPAWQTWLQSCVPKNIYIIL